jgi:probable HAF family extracellular repeat protein
LRQWPPFSIAAMTTRYCVLSFLVAAGFAHGATQYAVTDLGIPSGGISSSASAINASGQIAGSYQDSSFKFHAVYWPGMSAAPMALPVPVGATSSQSVGIDGSGKIVGSYTNATSTYACVWNTASSSPSTLATPAGASIYYGTGINAAGVILGFFFKTVGSAYQACYWNSVSSAATSLPNPAGAVQSYAEAINSQGRIVGGFQNAGSSYQACVWASTSASPSTLPVPSGTQSSIADGINNSGEIVGSFSTTAINLAGSRACLWSGNSVTDLNTLIDTASGWVLTTANGIDDSDNIVGVGSINGVTHAVLLTPIPISAPVLSIKGKRKRVTGKARLVLHGMATSSATSVTYKVGKKTRRARGSANWKFTIRLKPGRNILTVIAHGPGGDSAPVKMIIIRRSRR